MRIISGNLKGKRIIAPKSIKARPTTDFGKESLFNILENKIELTGIEALDLFAGTGNISFELASRGVKKVYCVDQQKASVNFIKDFAKKLDLPISVIKNDVFRFLSTTQHTYDLIFADPPYDLNRIPELPNMIFNSNMLSSNGFFVLEHGAENDFSKHENFIEKRTYSRVNFSFFKHIAWFSCTPSSTCCPRSMKYKTVWKRLQPSPFPDS